MERKSRGNRFSKRTIQEAVEEVESGFSRQEVCEKYGVSYSTLSEWLSKYGGANFLAMRRPVFTDQQRRSIAREVLEGRKTLQEAKLAYGIKGRNTIRHWIRALKQEKYDHIDLTKSTMASSTKTSPQDLQAALEAANLKVLALETMIDIAEAQFKIKIRKKPGAKQ